MTTTIIEDAVGDTATIKPSGVSAASTDPALVVAVSPNNILPIKMGDTSSVDAFGRLRASQPFTIFESKQTIDSRSIVWSTLLTSGGTAPFSSNRASSTLTVTSTPGSQAIRQTKPRFSYQAGKSLEIMNSLIMAATPPGITKRVGYFDDSNGVFLENDGYNVSFNLRSNVTGTPATTRVIQSAWNIDKFDGTGPSKITLDITKAQIMFIDLEWLGTGRIRFGFNMNGTVYYAHQILNANNVSSVYMSSPNLPMRYEITNVASASGSTLEQICSTVISEGGFDNKGYQFGADRGITVISSASNAIVPVISIRIAAASAGTIVGLLTGTVFCNSSNANFRWELILNPTVAGSDAASWTSITNAAIQYDVSRTASNTISGGTILASGYGSEASGEVRFDINSLLTLGIDLAGVADQVVLGVQKIGTGSDDFLGSIGWKEFV